MPHPKGHTVLSVRNSGAQAEKPEHMEEDSRTLVFPKLPPEAPGQLCREHLHEAHHISVLTR